MSLLVANNICKSLNGVNVISSLSFSVNKGEVITITGSNGSGKTTLVQLLTGLLKPDSGNIQYSINNIKRNIGYVTETPVLWSNLSVIEHIEIVKDLYNLKKIDEIHNTLYKELKLNNFKNKITSELSNGNKKKLNFFISVLHNPKIYILDEPFNTLDESSLDTIINYLKGSLDKNCSVVLTTNRHDILEMFNKKIIDLNGDKI